MKKSKTEVSDISPREIVKILQISQHSTQEIINESPLIKEGTDGVLDIPITEIGILPEPSLVDC